MPHRRRPMLPCQVSPNSSDLLQRGSGRPEHRGDERPVFGTSAIDDKTNLPRLTGSTEERRSLCLHNALDMLLLARRTKFTCSRINPVVVLIAAGVIECRPIGAVGKR